MNSAALNEAPLLNITMEACRALSAFGTSIWSLRTTRNGSGVRSKRWRPLVLVFHRSFQALSSSERISEYTIERYLVGCFSCGAIRVTNSLAGLSASSFPGMPL